MPTNVDTDSTDGLILSNGTQQIPIGLIFKAFIVVVTALGLVWGSYKFINSFQTAQAELQAGQKQLQIDVNLHSDKLLFTADKMVTLDNSLHTVQRDMVDMTKQMMALTDNNRDTTKALQEVTRNLIELNVNMKNNERNFEEFRSDVRTLIKKEVR